MELRKELDSCYIKAERMTKTDDNENYFIISLWNTDMYYIVLLLCCQHIWKEIGVRVYQIGLASTPYQSFYVVHLSGEDMK